MYHTMYPPQMMVQIMANQQINGQCLPVQAHPHFNGPHSMLQNEYFQYMSEMSTHNRNRIAQTGAYPLELLHLMSPDVTPLRRIGYVQGNSNLPNGNWQRRMSSTNNLSTPSTPHLGFRASSSTYSQKKPNWNNKAIKRGALRNSFSQKEAYSNDNGINSRSPTPSKSQTDGSQTESSDERDSISSTIEQGIKRLHEVHLAPNAMGHNISNIGVMSEVPIHHMYPAQRPLVYYNNSTAIPRSQNQNYQNKRRYHSGRNSPPSQRNPRSRRFGGSMVPNYNMFSRHTIAPERFLARSHLIEVTQTPKGLVLGSAWDELSQDIWKKFMANQQTEHTFRNKMMLWKCLYVLIKTNYPKYGLFLVGSTMNGFGSDNSDVDMCLLVRHTEMDQRSEAVSHLEQIFKCLKHCDFIKQLELIQAKVPILKFHDINKNLEVDLNCNNAVGIRNTHLLYCYSRIDWRVRPLVLVIKLWAQAQNINDAKNMTISSYSLVLMVIHFLQCGAKPAVLPCLHALYPEKFSPLAEIHTIDIHEELNIPTDLFPRRNRQSLGELLYEFFGYYVTFDYSQYAISVRLAKKVFIEDCRRARSYKNDPHQWKYLCIEEPFDLTNTARSVYDPDVFAKIKKVFGHTYLRLKNRLDLNRIFV
ncbi:poly(A) RNA polymerase gld-2 homolog A-like isoform X2 [Prorops nasuta]|uniref:poly(A) RNA polymerase gld-2 homolog A-like isoform X2 n=1 Tax=Prorops nasuta TaxID=863751 RepID=UPI0034CDC0E4